LIDDVFGGGDRPGVSRPEEQPTVSLRAGDIGVDEKIGWVNNPDAFHELWTLHETQGAEGDQGDHDEGEDGAHVDSLR
jgi:hypothetical protein